MLGVCRDLEVVLIAALDSTNDLAASPALATYRSSGLQIVGSQVYATRDLIRRMLADSTLFTGFDEVWMLPNPPSTPRPKTFALTTDVEDLGDLSTIARWMEDVGARVGLGDGVGLRVVAFEADWPDCATSLFSGKP